MIRAHIRFDKTSEAQAFVECLNRDGSADKYTITDGTGAYRANARSLMGVIYAMSDFCDHMYLVNETEDGVFPGEIDKYRI